MCKAENTHCDQQPSISIQVLERMYAILNYLASHDEAVSLKEICAATSLHPSTAHRILTDLVAGRLIERVDFGSYHLGLRLLELGNLVKSRLRVRDIALPFMRQLHRQTQQTVNLSIRQGDEIVYIERAYSERSGMQVVRAVGSHAPLHLTSTGKLLLADMDPKWVRTYASRTGLAGNTRNSITQLNTLEQELQRIRTKGVSVDIEELELEVSCVAVGIFDDMNKLIAGLSISSPSAHFNENWIQLLQVTAQNISQAIGYQK